MSMVLHSFVDESQSILLNEPNWIQEYLGRFMNIASQDLDRIQLSMLEFIVYMLYTLYLWIEWQGSRYSSSDFIWNGYNELPCFR